MKEEDIRLIKQEIKNNREAGKCGLASNNEKFEWTKTADALEKALDYITNLQEENEKIKQERQNIDNRNRNQKIANRKLQEEIESVRKNNRTRKSRCRKQTKKKNMYKTRNEKAIEYINNGYLSDGEMVNILARQDLLNILQGKSDE